MNVQGQGSKLRAKMIFGESSRPAANTLSAGAASSCRRRQSWLSSSLSCTHRDTHRAHTSCLPAFAGHTAPWQAAGLVQAEPLLQGAACHWKIFADCNLAGLLDPAAQLKSSKGCSTISTLHFTPHAALYTTAQHIVIRHPIVRSNSAVCSRHFLARNARL
jgi:hypothetical protein